MLKVLNSSVDSGVFVTTTAIIDGSDTTQTGEYYTLSDFENKTDFMKEIKEDFAVRGSLAAPTFVFQDHPTTFTPLNLVGEHDLDAQIWDFLELNDDDELNMTVAFASAYGMQHGDSHRNAVSATLEAARERSYGQHSNDVDFAYSELESQGIMQKLPPIIENNLAIDDIAISLMRSNNIAVTKTPNGNFYFRDY